MAINTKLGDTLDGFYENLIAGKSGLVNWHFIKTDGIYSKVGGDLSDYDVDGKVASLKGQLSTDEWKRLRKIVRGAPFSTRLSMLCASDAWLDAGLDKAGIDPTRFSVIVSGHNLNKFYQYENDMQFLNEPDYMDPMAAVRSLDTDHAGSVAEVLNAQGSIYTMGGACASANVALRNAVDEVRYHEHDVAMVVGAALEFSPMSLHAMALLGAISFQSFNENPEKASRPYDLAREGFIPSHGAAVLVVETLEHAKARGAKIYAEVLGVEAMSDASHLPSPSLDGQARTMTRLLKVSGVTPDQIDFVSAHATSTPLGDMTELGSIKKVFGDHAKNLKINAPKSMLGHTCWSAPAVETVAAIMQMQKGWLHPSINIENKDPEVDLNVCANEPVQHQIRLMLKNSFGFGGINCCSLLKRYED
ncbi:MAG: beta-ketoacyl-[acyl-carrier-protein] synthase family protein [Myxococcales bacterium]|nr:beta-ketoacyl-[acyl-carrier-protein] synthase family protein [Myxococcales bacterium]MCB9643879.1 beta-ketoacyl-[acyl-carrier-protein] synthase family protein [Myxococcales bacterium]